MRRANGEAPQAHRLPVNHRRHKVPPEHRKRVVAACNNCNVRRIKCSGERPCSHCKSTARDCQYPVQIEKIQVPRSEWEDMQAKCAMLEQRLKQLPDDQMRQDMVTSPPGSSTMSSTMSSSTTTPDAGLAGNGPFRMEPHEEQSGHNDGRLLADQHGTARYFGSTSGATFLDQLREFIIIMLPLARPNAPEPADNFLQTYGQYQTSDSQPLLPHLHVNPRTLPTKHEMHDMMSRLRFFIQDGRNGEFGSGGIFYWGGLDPSMLEVNHQESPIPTARLALFQAAFALACLLDTPQKSKQLTRQGEIYFTRARKLLGNPLDTTQSTVHHIPVLAMMSLYLVEMNRRDAAYLYVSWGMHLAIMYGVHTVQVGDSPNTRPFWTLYILDRWLSCLMGRPPSILDSSIQLPMPCSINGMPSEKGLKAHVELSRICGYIVCDTYQIASSDSNPEPTERRIETTLDKLSRWFNDLAPELRMHGSSFSQDRSACELHMTYWQLVLLTVRPLFFTAVKKVVADRLINARWDLASHGYVTHIQRCVEAARHNLQLGRWVRQHSPNHKLLASTLHHIFNAAVVLLLSRFLFGNNEGDARDIDFAMDCFDAEAKGESNYPRDCLRVLEEVKTLIQQLQNQHLDAQPPRTPQQQQLSPRGPIAMGGHPLATSSPGVPMQQMPPTTTAYDVNFLLNHELSSQQIISGNTGLLENLQGWLAQDTMILYEQFPGQM